MTINLTATASFIQVERNGEVIALVPKGLLGIKPENGRLVLSSAIYHEELSPGDDTVFQIGGVSAGAALGDWLAALALAPGFSLAGSVSASLSAVIARLNGLDAAVALIGIRFNLDEVLITANASAVTTLNANVSTLTSAVAVLQTANITLAARVTALEAAGVVNAAAIAAAQADILANNTAIGLAAAAIAAIQTAVSNLQAADIAHAARLTAAEGDILALYADYATLTTALATTNAAVTAIQVAATALAARVTTAEGNIAANTTAIAALNTSMGAANTAITALQTVDAAFNVRLTADEATIATNTANITTNAAAIASEAATRAAAVTTNATAISVETAARVALAAGMSQAVGYVQGTTSRVVIPHSRDGSSLTSANFGNQVGFTAGIAWPFVPLEDMTFSEIWFFCGFAVGGAYTEMGAYLSDTTTHLPTTLAATSGQILVATATLKVAVLGSNVLLPKHGLVWLFMNNTSSATGIYCHSGDVADKPFRSAVLTPQARITFTTQAGAMPNTFPTPTIVNASAATPAMAFKLV